MEIETRYVIPDRATRRRLAALKRLDTFTISPLDRVCLVDHYLDTPTGSLRHQGWACRLRSTDGAWSVTLKGQAQAQGAISSRLELESPLAAPSTDPACWPAGDVRHLVSDLAADAPLQEVVVISQRRTRRAIHVGTRRVAELTLDRVSVRADGLCHRSDVLECELGDDGRLEDLQRFAGLLEREHLLTPEPRTKLERALDAVALAERTDQEELPSVPPERLLALYGVDVRCARQRAEVAEMLFNALKARHRLAPWYRTLVRTAALLCDVGAAVNYPGRAGASRDILLRQPLDGIDDEDRVVLAAAAYLHRGKSSAKRLRKAFPRPMWKTRRRDALRVAALVRMACALSPTPTGETMVERIVEEGDAVRITLSGPDARKNVRRARRRSDLWARLLPDGPRWEASDIPAHRRLGLRYGDTMREAGARMLAFHTASMLAHERGTREGNDPEELHDMRVAVRRLRSGLRLFGAYMLGDAIDGVVADLREAGAALGAVRDLDISIGQARAYRQQRTGSPAAGLNVLISGWERLRQARRTEMLAYLDGDAYQRLVGRLRQLLAQQAERAGAAAGVPPVAEAAGRYVSVYWRTVLAYGDVIAEAPIHLLHALRIDCKRLRYTLEFLREALPPEARRVTAAVVRMQDHLGRMHDAAVTADRLTAFLTRRRATPAEGLSGVCAYLEDREAEARRMRKTAPEAWSRLTRKRVSRAVARILG